MKIVIAPDSFKGSLTAPKAAEAMKEGLARVWPSAEYVLYPIADGGDGTVEILAALTGGRLVATTVQGPLGRPVEAFWGLLGDGQTAVIEVAAASGLTLLRPEERDPGLAGSFGSGELLGRILDFGIKKLVVGLGGSAVNDAGSGLMSALGVRFLDKAGQLLPPGGLSLNRLNKIDIRGLDPRLKTVDLVVASDVQSPLCGPLGASHIFGPQKGATPDMVPILDAALEHWAQTVKAQLGRDVKNMPGAGAAGGLGAAFMAFTGAVFRPGIEVVLEYGDFENKAKGADLIITGEGSTDAQSAFGKGPGALIGQGRRLGAPVYILSGALGPGAEKLSQMGAAGVEAITPPGLDLGEAMRQAASLLRQAAENLGRRLAVERADWGA